MDDFEGRSSDSDMNEEEEELQEAFAAGLLKPGLNIVSEEKRKEFVNNVKGLHQKINEIKLDLPWIEILDNVNKEAPLAPELAAKMSEQEDKRVSQLKHNQKLAQFNPMEDPVLNDFKREMLFLRQAQATVMQALPKLKAMGLSTIRPDDYFAEMAKTDDHMQKIRKRLMKKQVQQQQVERIRQLRVQRKEGKAIQIQTKLQRLQEKKEMLDQVKKVRKGLSKDMSFLDGKKPNNKSISRKSVEKRKMKDKKFGFGGKKRGNKQNTRDSSHDISEYKSGKRGNAQRGKGNAKGASKQQRPGKSKRMQKKSRGKK